MILTKAVQDQIDWLHQQVGNTEWSGILVYTIEEGSIARPKDLVMKVQGIFLLDIGSPGYTEFNIGHHIMDLMEEFPGCEEDPAKWKMGKIHTHHNMGAYHSGTDMSDLHDNAPNFAFYLSLVVDFFDHTDTKIAVHTKEDDRTIKHSDGAGGTCSSIIPGEEMVMIIDVETTGEERTFNVPEGLRKMYDTLEAEEKDRVIKAAAQKAALANKARTGPGVHLPVGKQISLPLDDVPSDLFTGAEISRFSSVWLGMDHINDGSAVGVVISVLDQHDAASLEVHTNMMKENFERMASEFFETDVTEEIAAMLIEQVAEFINNTAFDSFKSSHKIREVIDDLELEYNHSLSEF